MAKDIGQAPDPAHPHLIKGDEGGPLSRQLVGVSLKRMVQFLNRASSLRYTRASGLSDFEWRLLARLCETPELSLGELAMHLRCGGAQASRTVKRLVAAGLVHSRGRGGGPGVIISPTAEGREAYAPLIALAAEADRALLAGLSEDEIEGLRRCIEVLTENALATLAHEQQLAQDRAAKADGRGERERAERG